MWVYKVSKFNLDGWKEYTLNHAIERSDVQSIIPAIMAVKSKVKEMSDWDGDGEYWLTKLPGVKQKVVAIRPGPNPYAEVYLVSPKPLSGLYEIADHVYA